MRHMSKFLSVLVCMMFVVQEVRSQDKNIPTDAATRSLSSASDFARLYVGPVEPQYQLSLWYDNPYY